MAWVNHPQMTAWLNFEGGKSVRVAGFEVFSMRNSSGD